MAIFSEKLQKSLSGRELYPQTPVCNTRENCSTFFSTLPVKELFKHIYFTFGFKPSNPDCSPATTIIIIDICLFLFIRVILK